MQNLKQHDFIGELEFALHEVVTSRDQTLSKMLVNPQKKSPGTVFIHGEEMAAQANTEHVMFVPEVTGLKDMSGQIFFIVFKNLGPGQYTPVYKSETKAQ